MTNKTTYGASVNPTAFGGKLIDFDYDYVPLQKKTTTKWTMAVFDSTADALRYLKEVIEADRFRTKGTPKIKRINYGPSLGYDHQVDVTYGKDND